MKIRLITFFLIQTILLTSCYVCYKEVEVKDENINLYSEYKMSVGVDCNNHYVYGSDDVVKTTTRLALWFLLDSTKVNYNRYFIPSNNHIKIKISNLKISTMLIDDRIKDSLRIKKSSTILTSDWGWNDKSSNIHYNQILPEYIIDVSYYEYLRKNPYSENINIIFFIDVDYEPLNIDYLPDGSIVEVEFNLENENGKVLEIKRKEVFEKGYCGVTHW